MIACATLEPYTLSSPCSSAPSDSLNSERSQILIAHDPSLSLTKKKFKYSTLAQMSSERQQVISNINSFNSQTNYVSVTAGPDAERDQILQWLSPLEPQQRHQGVRTDRLDGVGNWVLETNEFRKWCDAEDGCVSPVLFCYGSPGVGKTYLR